MFERDDRIYYEKRAAQATELGERATNPKIASLHHELALRYMVLSVKGAGQGPKPSFNAETEEALRLSAREPCASSARQNMTLPSL